MPHERASLRGLQSVLPRFQGSDFEEPEAFQEPIDEGGAGILFADARSRLTRPIAPDTQFVNPMWARWFDMIKKQAGGRDIDLVGGRGSSAFQPAGRAIDQLVSTEPFSATPGYYRPVRRGRR